MKRLSSFFAIHNQSPSSAIPAGPAQPNMDDSETEPAQLDMGNSTFGPAASLASLSNNNNTLTFSRESPANPQDSSPFFNGRIPAEIRDQIFHFVLSEDVHAPYGSTIPYKRPGYEGKKKIDTSLLQTCQRVYREACHIPVLNREHVFYHAPETGPNPSNFRDRFGHEAETELFTRRMAPWQLELVKEIHLFTQSFWLEQSFAKLCEEEFMQGIEKVKITLRRSDWWWNERNEMLAINPMRGNANIAQMTRDILAENAGETIPWNTAGWGGAFANLKSLKEMEIEFETSEDKQDELIAIVGWANGWEFPLKDGKVLSTEGLKPTSTTWQSPLSFWSRMCPYCGRYSKCAAVDPVNEKCEARKELRERNVGPLCYVFSLRWKVAEGGAASS